MSDGSMDAFLLSSLLLGEDFSYQQFYIYYVKWYQEIERYEDSGHNRNYFTNGYYLNYSPGVERYGSRL